MKKFIIIIGTLFFMLGLAVIENQAATRTVTNLNDSGAGSLRQTIISANAGDTIVFAAGLSGTIFLGDHLFINKSLTINGPGANVLTVEGRSSPTEVNVFQIWAGTSVISDLRIANGFSSGAGGGVIVEGGNLTLNNCLISGNEAESAGGVFVGTGSTLTITNSTISGNSSAVEGGGVSNRGGTLTLINSTITGNQASDGGGVSVENGTATILNSTITGNGNSIPQTGNIGGLRIVGSTVNLKNTIVADNIGSPTAPTDIGGTVNSQGNNLIKNITGATINGNTTGNITGQDPQLVALANNGGTTLTQALMAGSPAIDTGNNTGAPVTDQRGVVRPQGVMVDIGAFESGVAAWNGATTTGTNITVAMGTVSTNFLVVGTAGTTTAVPINPANVGTVPSGYSLGAGFPAYEITTTASYTAPIIVCIQVSSTTPLATFNALRILHYVNGTPTDATILSPDTPAPDFMMKKICARVNSLSPFVVAQDLAPLAANVNVGGRVSTSNGRGIAKARVSITNQNGETRNAITNAFGFYQFDEIPVGETYIISVSHKRYQFNSQVITVSEEIQNADFTAEP